MWHAAGFVFACAAMLARPAGAAVLTPGNLLIDVGQSAHPADTVYEYTTSGSKLQSWLIPNAPSGNPNPRGLVADGSGNVRIFNGTFQPWLATLNPSTGTVTQTQGDFSSSGTTYEGGVAVYKNYIFVSDYNTGGSVNNGIVRFDASNGYTQTRFRPNVDYRKVSIGADGLLYAVNDSGYTGGPGIDVLNPLTGSLLQGFATPGINPSGVVADAQGNMYVADFSGGSIYKYNPAGTGVNSRALSLGNLLDIAISPTNQLAVATTLGDVVMTDTSLATETFFQPANGVGFVAFTSPIPEPSAAAGLVLAALALGRRRRGSSI